MRRHDMPQHTIVLPERTFVVPGVALAAIRSVEGGLWLMDSLITNPLCSSGTRNAALNSLYKHILANYSPILAWSAEPDAIARAVTLGFKVIETNKILKYTKDT